MFLLQYLFKPYSYLPFSAGPRSCLGNVFAVMEVKICLAQIINRFRIYSTNKTDIPLKLIKLTLPTKYPTKVILGIEKRIKLDMNN